MDDGGVLMRFDADRGVAYARMRMPDHASFSSLDGWMACPGRWVAGRLMPKPARWGSPLVLGGIVHAALETACRTPDDPLPDWRALCLAGIRVERERVRARGWGDDPVPRDAVMGGGRVASDKDWASAAARKLSGFRLSDALGRRLDPVACEQELHVMVGGIPLTGSVDCRDRTGVVVDWKTGRVPDRSDGRRRHADQLRVYRMMLDAVGVRVVSARDVYVEHHAWREADLSDGACLDTLSRMRGAWDGLRRGVGRGVFPLRPSGLCAWCPVARACPLARIVPAGRVEAMSSVGLDDPRVSLVGTHTGGVDRFDGKEGKLDLLDLISSAPVAEGAESDAVSSTPGACVSGAERRWGVDGPAPDPWAMPAESKPEPEPEPVKRPEPEDPWAMPAGRTESEPEPVKRPELKPKPETEAKPAPEPESEPDAVPGLTLMEGRPYEPSLTGHAVNTAGYGFTGLLMQQAHATLMAGTHPEWAEPLAMELTRVQWAAARKAFGPIIPDIPGLADGRPQPDALLAWMDTTLHRDTDRVMRLILDRDPMLQPGETDTLDGLRDRIRLAGRRTADTLSRAVRVLGDA